jgi:hypothetical protein
VLSITNFLISQQDVNYDANNNNINDNYNNNDNNSSSLLGVPLTLEQKSFAIFSTFILIMMGLWWGLHNKYFNVILTAFTYLQLETITFEKRAMLKPQ